MRKNSKRQHLASLHASSENYLGAILILHMKKDTVRFAGVAWHLGVSKPSVCHTVALLRDGSSLTMDEDFSLYPTDMGREATESIYERHCFFTERLIATGVNPKVAEADACRIEHIISAGSFERLREATKGVRQA